MKILLINPPITKLKEDRNPISKSWCLGLAYISSALKKYGYEVRVLDCLRDSYTKTEVNPLFVRYGLTDNEIKSYISMYHPDVVAISSMFSAYHKDAHNIARIAKEFNSHIWVIMGGSHPTTFPLQVARNPRIDQIVIGEGECDFVKKPSLLRPLNIDEIGFPDWEAIKKDIEIVQKEQEKNPYIMRKPVGFILSSRGCPNQCYFCSVKLTSGNKWRPRSVENIIREMETLYTSYGIREFHFVDDNVSVDPKRLELLCDKLIGHPYLKVRLACPTGISIMPLNFPLLKKMKKAGFYRLCFGIETGSQEGQVKIKKNINLDRARTIINYANRLGFWTSATFILGFPHEMKKDIVDTIWFAVRSGIDWPVFYLLCPQPRTEVYELMKKAGLIDLDECLNHDSYAWYRLAEKYYTGTDTVHFKKEQLKAFQDMAYREFFRARVCSLRTYINLIRKIRSFEDLRYTLKLSRVPLGMLLNIVKGKRLTNTQRA